MASNNPTNTTRGGEMIYKGDSLLGIQLIELDYEIVGHRARKIPCSKSRRIRRKWARRFGLIPIRSKEEACYKVMNFAGGGFSYYATPGIYKQLKQQLEPK